MVKGLNGLLIIFNMKCEVCHKELIKDYEDHLDAYGPLLEESYRCEDKHYYYDFAYGNTTICILGHNLGWSYNSSLQYMLDISARIKKIIKEDYKGRIKLRIG